MKSIMSAEEAGDKMKIIYDACTGCTTFEAIAMLEIIKATIMKDALVVTKGIIDEYKSNKTS